MVEGVFRWIWDETVLQGLVARFSMLLLLAAIAVCIAALSKGADSLIDGVVQLARRTRIPGIVIGATVVSLGTTAPEAVVSVMAAWMGNPGLALGNGVGSIIADTGLIFGLTCLLSPMPANRFILNRTGWVQAGAATTLVVISLAIAGLTAGPPVLGRWVGFLFLALLCGYLFMSYRWAAQGAALEKGTGEKSEAAGLLKSWLMVIGGLGLVVMGARILVPCAAEAAHRLGVPDDVIAATLVAFGTSLPELMTAVSAVRKGHPEITVGNVVGADVLNCLFVIGAAAAARPLAIPANFFTFHFPAMLIILYSFRYFIHVSREGRFRRGQGAWLLGVYLVYIILQYTLTTGTATG